MSSSSSSTNAESASTCSDSDASISTTSSSVPRFSCFFNPSTCRRQNFSISDKIVCYMAKNPSNAKTFKKLIQTCKYFFIINPVIVVRQLECYGVEWVAYYGVNRKYNIRFKYDQPVNFKIWVTHKCRSFFGDASQVIPWIYKNDATVVYLESEPLKFDQFLFLAGKAEKLTMWRQLIKYENGEIVQLEDIVKNLSKLKSFTIAQRFDGGDLNSNTVRKLMRIENFKRISQMKLYNILEDLDVEEMFNLILENKHILIDLCYREEISNAYKELVRDYSNRLKNEEGCNSVIEYELMDVGTFSDLEIAISVDDSSDDDNVSDVDENEDFLFPWKNEDEEEWELPWDKE